MPFVDPVAMGIDCGLARDRDLRFLHADAFDRRTPHAFTVDYFLVRCSMHEDAGMCATSDPYREILPVMSVSSDFVCGAGKPEIRAGLRYVAQSRLIIDRVAERQSRDDALTTPMLGAVLSRFLPRQV